MPKNRPQFDGMDWQNKLQPDPRPRVELPLAALPNQPRMTEWASVPLTGGWPFTFLCLETADTWLPLPPTLADFTDILKGVKI